MRRFALLAIVLGSLLQHQVAAQDVDWSTAFRFQTTGGFENPALLVAFNPQPEPPAYQIAPEIDLSESTMLKMTIPDIAVSDGGAQILFAVPEGFFFEAEGEPEGTSFDFQTFGQGPQDVHFDMTTGSGGVAAPGSWIAFNPQPEPPAGWIGMGFNFEFTSNSPATLVIQILDDGVEPLLFELIQGADFNGDGDVDNGDLKTWQNNYGVGTFGDANFDGRTDGADFVLWQRQYTGPVGIVGVPEPSGLLLSVGGIALLTLIRSPREKRCKPRRHTTVGSP